MSIKPRTYYEAFCDAPEHRDDKHPIEFGEYTAFRDADHIADELRDRDGLLCADGRVFCSWDCRQTDVCPGTDDNVHVLDGGDCLNCSYSEPPGQPVGDTQ